MRSKQARRARLRCAGRALREARCLSVWVGIVEHMYDTGGMYCDVDGAPSDKERLDDARKLSSIARQHAEAMVARAAR